MFTELIKREPNNAMTYEARAFFKGLTGDIDGAFKDANKSISLNPNSAGAYYVRGSAYLIYGDKVGAGPNELKTKAIKDLTKCIELDGSKVNPYYWRGIARKSVRKYDAAFVMKCFCNFTKS